ncbi:isocitrate lyase/PEP mutase family protein [Niveispirillum cyanobacteriorum]|uniref:Carboxyvinyl-carboxyphosphonate phosphorylmutase n=1 Tax=Niveispirillum cyanobacteriorum TaxID=1612173 RepID=A0A2K9NGM4_9PROT|nr:isocitrate lyase/PEP mutase family protein [Niveispirillum cyanobacteriorum]AUN32192.1 carboxyvinyl-carboxyphosphonate phosphorylmutase [Niveispirillum cyanobacteriorum]GGE75016.1 carboxyvinyl-carboxyphosphonate phosphorylmutase [Niveispirillum cyanobacteriorum]
MANPILRQKLASRQFITAPGIQDMIAAVIANKVGFDIVYGSGYWTVASAYGLPDAGIASVTQMVDRMATLVRTCNAAVVADADTGFGGLLNVHHTVQAYEQAGITAIQIEDQEFPKKCGHTPGKRVVPAEEMADKIRVAVEARRDENFLIIARTDARQSEGLEGVLHRMKLYAEAGADILFPEALTSDEEARIVTSSLDKPMMANMADGGLTPIRDAKTLQSLGYSMAIFPAMTSLAAAAAMESALLNLKQTGTSLSPDVPLFNFKEFCSLIGFEDVWAFDKKWAR